MALQPGACSMTGFVRDSPRTHEERDMAGDAEWVEDVRRWYFAGKRSGASSPAGEHSDGSADADALGYEAADPSLQSQHWPDAPSAVPMPMPAPDR